MHACRTDSSTTRLIREMFKGVGHGRGGSHHCTDWVRKEVTISRAEFENGCQELFQRAMEPVGRVLEAYGFDVDDIDEAVLVGGASRIPLIRAELKKTLRLKSLNIDIDPDLTVAYGATTVAQ